MSEVKHTPTPWVLNTNQEVTQILGADGECVACDTSYYPTPVYAEDQQHIVKCVNLHDELLERLEEAQKAISTLLLVTVGITPTETMVQETINEAADYTISGKIRECLKKAGAL